ncbi:fasciclin domain-containing protein [Pleomorphovibrio marinus]|uniref:fasciclin domain-containing protein n=1 Tax=Pleomorphovibrio marinus TaxID=2164132 RepID=UPI000E0B64AF|nr:fasciclin domain-containing protein [Pleomorphovibrio marinus]
MKTKFTLPLLFLLVCLAGSCFNQVDEPPGTLSATLVKNRFFNLMESALIRTGLIVPLSNPNPDREAEGYTLFAPTDHAFKEFENRTGRKVDDLQRDFLHELLQGHLHSGILAGEELRHGTFISMLNGNEIHVVKDQQNTFVNGAKLVFTDAPSTNGVLHGLDKVIFNSDKSVLDWVSDFKSEKVFLPGELSIFYAALWKSGLVQELETASNLTVFAPSDLAFRQAGILSEQDLENWSPQKLKEILNRHFIKSNTYFSHELNGQKIVTQGNEIIEIDFESNGSLKFSFQGSEKSTNAILTDIAGSQGIMFIIDRVIGEY